MPADWVKYLRVVVDAEANFKMQRSLALTKAWHKAEWVLRTFYTRDHRIMLTLWKTLVQPHLDYCGQLWKPVNLPGDT